LGIVHPSPIILPLPPLFPVTGISFRKNPGC